MHSPASWKEIDSRHARVTCHGTFHGHADLHHVRQCHQHVARLGTELLVVFLLCPGEYRTVRTCSILRMILVAPRTRRPRRSSSSGALMPHAYDTTCRRQKGIQPRPNTAIALPNPWYTCTAPWRCARTTGCSSPRTASFGGKKGCCIIAMCDAQW
jgi:hypothetical protein